jgi:hypothetical protein
LHLLVASAVRFVVTTASPYIIAQLVRAEPQRRLAENVPLHNSENGDEICDLHTLLREGLEGRGNERPYSSLRATRSHRCCSFFSIVNGALDCCADDFTASRAQLIYGLK